MVKAATMAGSRGGLHRKEVDVDGDYGMPLSSPELIIPIVALVFLVILAFVGCFCKLFSCCCFGKTNRSNDLELQLGRKTRIPSSLRKKSELLRRSSSDGGGHTVTGVGVKRSISTKTTCSTLSQPEDRQKHKNRGGDDPADNRLTKVKQFESPSAKYATNHSNEDRDSNNQVSRNNSRFSTKHKSSDVNSKQDIISTTDETLEKTDKLLSVV